MKETFKSLEMLLEEKINKLGKRNDNHLTPRRKKEPDNYEMSKSKWNHLKDSVINLRSLKKKKPLIVEDKVLHTENNEITAKEYTLPKLWTIRHPVIYNVLINGHHITWNPPVVLLRIEDIQPMYDFELFDSAQILLKLVGNSNLSPYFKQKQNTTARFFRQWANIELAYFRFDEAIEVLEMGIELDAQPIHELVDSRDSIRNKLINNRIDEKMTKMTPLKTPRLKFNEKYDSLDHDSLSDALSDLEVTPTKQRP
jgi:hypothetical protein